jgi:PAP2 superfamily
MTRGARLLIQGFLSFVLLASSVALAGSAYFYALSMSSEFLWLCLASTAIIHLTVRPRWSEGLLLALTTLAFSSVVFFILRFPPHIMAVFALLGLSSLVILGLRAVWAPKEGRELLLWAFVPSVLFVAFGWLTPPLLQYGEAAHPKVLDLYLYSFDCSLGFQPSFLLGRAFQTWHWLRSVSYFFYLGLSVPIAVVYAGQLVRNRKSALPVMLALLYCGPIGAIFYNIFPALGPVHLFHQDFPWHPLAISHARQLLLEPVPLSGFRNAIPSLHMAWVLLAWWYCRGLSRWTKSVVLAFVFFTVLATLGSGEHYLVDLVVAFPFCVMVQGVFAFSLPWKSSPRLSSVLLGVSIVLAWLSILRFANPLFWISPAVPWALIAATILASVLQQRKLEAATVQQESSREPSSSPAVPTPVAELVGG